MPPSRFRGATIVWIVLSFVLTILLVPWWIRSISRFWSPVHHEQNFFGPSKDHVLPIFLILAVLWSVTALLLHFGPKPDGAKPPDPPDNA